MKIYGKIKSERAEKGQGGNDFLEIQIAKEDQKVIAMLNVFNDKKNNQLLLTFIPLGIQEYADQKGKSLSLENKTRRWCISL